MAEILELTAKIVSAHIAHHSVATSLLPELIRSVYQSLSTVGTIPKAAEPQSPAVPVRKSVFPTYIICLEDGKKLKMMKRHLMTSYGMTPGEYREKWHLPRDYPMVAPEYAATRSTLAKSIGLGRKPAAAVEPEVTKVPARRAKGSKG